MPKFKGRYYQVAKTKLKKGKMEGKQRGSAVSVKGFTYFRKVKGQKARKKVTVKAYKRGRPGGKRG